MLSKYGEQHSMWRPSRKVCIHHCKAAGALVRSNGIQIHSYKPQGVLKAVMCLDHSSTKPWWPGLDYPWPKMENKVNLPKLSNLFCIFESGCQSVMVLQFNSQKLTHSCRLLSFFNKDDWWRIWWCGCLNPASFKKILDIIQFTNWALLNWNFIFEIEL